MRSGCSFEIVGSDSNPSRVTHFAAPHPCYLQVFSHKAALNFRYIWTDFLSRTLTFSNTMQSFWILLSEHEQHFVENWTQDMLEYLVSNLFLSFHGSLCARAVDRIIQRFRRGIGRLLVCSTLQEAPRETPLARSIGEETHDETVLLNPCTHAASTLVIQWQRSQQRSMCPLNIDPILVVPHLVVLVLQIAMAPL